MSKNNEIESETIYAKTIEKVIKSMQIKMRSYGYPEDLLKKIQVMWKDHLKKAPRSKFSHITPFKLASVAPTPQIILKKPPTPIKQESFSESSHYSDSEDASLEAEEDPNLAIFATIKKEKQEALKIEETKELEESSFTDDDLQESDEETNLNYPEPTGIIHCLHEGVKRKGNCWSFNIRCCVFQECGRAEKFFRTAHSELDFLKKK